MYIKLILLLYLSSYSYADIKFPQNVPTDVEVYKKNMQNDQISQYQLKNSYDQFIDDIITKGVTDLGFNLHRSAKQITENVDNFLIYSPVSIATALYMLLLGSNGNTFTELSEILGVSQGLNIANNSIKIHEEFGEMLRNLESNTSEGTLVKFANGIFVQNNFSLRQQYVDVSSLVYQSETMNLEFKGNPNYAKDVINNWTSTKTFGKIRSILNESPSPETKVVIASSLYFKADWNTVFDSSLTALKPFYPNGLASPTNIKFNQMANKGKYPYYNDSVLNCEIVGIPYKGREYTFYIVIPHNSNKESLEQFESRLTYSDIKRLTASTVSKEILLAIPKMKLSSNLQLSEVLQDNGLHSLFDPHQSNLELLSSQNDEFSLPSYSTVNQFQEEPFVFSRMKDPAESDDSSVKRKKRNTSNRRPRQTMNNKDGNRKQTKRVLSLNKSNFDTLRHNLSKKLSSSDNPGLYVNKILHKVVIDVNEKGTEAAATTSAFIGKESVRVVKANVPFVFFIQHEETRMILFWGSVVIPSPYIVY